MILTATPYRISFLGGTSDYPSHYRKHGGAVLSCTVNRYCHLSVRRLPPFFDHATQVVWSKVERVQKHERIEHPAVREVLSYLDVTEGLSIVHDGDLPGRSGMGSSSAFAVGLLHAMRALRGEESLREPVRLAQDAIYVERRLHGDNVGSQDQVACAFGGLNRIDFLKDGSFLVGRVDTDYEWFERHLMLVFTGLQRDAASVAAGQQRTENEKLRLELQQLVDAGIDALVLRDIEAFAKLVTRSWELKRSLAECVSTPEVDEVLRVGLEAGALGGKLLGAGGGGFVLLIVPPEKRSSVLAVLPSECVHVPVRLEFGGSRIVYRE